MAKTSSIQRNLNRIVKSARALVKRKKLRATAKDVDSADQEAAVTKLNKSDRNESVTRIRNRCRDCGRSRGVYRKFGLCRIHLREAAMRGAIPGLKKASW